ncbi:MAG TPA: class A beta-lactamase [Pyrinomonadaceae bacterium]|nr:class A beta-lactamase [Pyrinomonadaceae bacterium]
MKFFYSGLLFLAFLSAGCEPGETNASNTSIATPSPTAEPTPDQKLTAELQKIEEASGGKLGVYAEILGSENSGIGLNDTESFAMQSVVKLPISMAVLKRVQQGELALDTVIEFTRDEMVPPRMHSPIRDKFPTDGKMTVEELIRAAMSVSNGTAADVLQRVAGGAKGVQSYLDSLNIEGMKVVYSHQEFDEEYERQYVNAVTPRGAVDLLRVLAEASITDNIQATPSAISKEHALFLLEIMQGTPTGPKRLKGLLPAGTAVAHKTGTSSSRDGSTAATNDAGIITLPDGRMLLIAVFVGDSKGDAATRELAIARSAKTLWDHWAASRE